MTFGPVFYTLINFFSIFSGFVFNEGYSGVSKIAIRVHTLQNPIDSNSRFVYFSFDDGPLMGTSNCIDVCTRENVAATFFEVGWHQSRSAFGRKLYNQISKKSNLFLIANHSFTHANGEYIHFYHHPDSALLDFLKAKIVLKTTNNITRLPGNNAWNLQDKKRTGGFARPLVNKLDSVGFNIVGWDLQWRFNRKGRPVQSPEEMALNVDSLFYYHQTFTKKHLVILMHDHMFRAPEDSIKLEVFIRLLKQRKHYRFEQLTSYPGLKPKID